MDESFLELFGRFYVDYLTLFYSCFSDFEIASHNLCGDYKRFSKAD